LSSPKLAASGLDVCAAAEANGCRYSPVFKDLGVPTDTFSRAARPGQTGDRIKGDQVYVAEEAREAGRGLVGLRSGVINLSNQCNLKRQPAVRAFGVAAACGEKHIEGVLPVDGYQSIP